MVVSVVLAGAPVACAAGGVDEAVLAFDAGVVEQAARVSDSTSRLYFMRALRWHAGSM
jgi:hypothetical protein